MRVEYIDPFVRALFVMLDALTDETPERGPLSMRSVAMTNQQLTIMLGVSGKVHGKVLYGMSVVTAQKIAFSMIGQPIKEMDDVAWTALGEFGVIMAETALKHLGQNGLECEITPPAVLRGTNIEVSTDVPAMVLPVATKLGRVEIDLALEQPQVCATSEMA